MNEEFLSQLEGFELMEISDRRIFGMEKNPDGTYTPYLYLVLRRISDGKFYEVNLGCPLCDEMPKTEEIKKKILEVVEQAKREIN